MVEKIISNAWKNYKNNIVSLVGGYVVSLLTPVVLTGIVSIVSFWPLIHTMLTQGLTNAFDLVKSNFIGYFLIPLLVPLIVALVLFPPFDFGFLYMVAQGSKRRKVKISMLFEGVKKFWKRAILQQILSLIIIVLVSLPLLVGIVTFSTARSIVGFAAYLIIWIIVAIGVAFFLILWTPVIVIYDIGVIESLKISVMKVRRNLLETFVIFLVMSVIGAAAGLLGRVIPLIPIIVLTPFIKAILVEACKSLR